MTKEEQDKKWWGGNNARKANFGVIAKRERRVAEAEAALNVKWKGYKR